MDAADAAAGEQQLRVAVFGTSTAQFNGYSKVLYELFKHVVPRHPGVKLFHFGFQQFYNNPLHRPDVPPEVERYDPWAHEEPKQAGFGVPLVKAYVERVRPHVCFVFNDMMVLGAVINELKDSPIRGTFRIVAYIDQVYLCQKKEFVRMINAHADAAVAFTPEWRDCIVRQGLTLPCDYLVHGFNPQTYYPVPRKLARRFFGLPEDDFLILNLNRNQPRKRWDTCLKAFAEVVHRLPDAPIKMVIGTDLKGGWDLMELYERELAKRGVPLDKGRDRLIVPGSPQQLLDFDTNVLYNVADVGINTCDGEGFGLCNFEQAGVGVPQVVPRLGGFLHIFDDTCAALVDPKVAVYVDSTRDGVGGEALISDYADFAEAIVAYYRDAELRKAHAAAGRRRVLERFRWPDIADRFVDIVRRAAPPRAQAQAQAQAQAPGAISVAEAHRLLDEVELKAAGGDPPGSTAAELRALRARLDALLGASA